MDAPQQQRLMNRFSGFFGKKQRQEEEGGGEAPATAMLAANASTWTDSSSLISNPQQRRPENDDDSSRVDSMFSSISSAARGPVNPNSPPPLRTVRLDQPIVHEQTSSSSSPLSTASSASATTLPPPQQQVKRKSNVKTMKPEEVDEAFDQLMQEYALASNIRPTLTQLTTEQKSVLLESSKSRMLHQRKNSTFSASFLGPLVNTLGIKRSSSQGRQSILKDKLFDDQSITSSAATTIQQQPKRRRRSMDNRISSTRSKHRPSPEYFVRLLKETPVRELDDQDVIDLRIFLRNVVVSWTTQFLAAGGYEAITDLFRQMKEAPKRSPQDDKILQQLAKCFKAIMTHEMMGVEKVLTDPRPLHHIRDLVFGPRNDKFKALYGLHVTTRAQLFQILCTLPSLQVTTGGEYVHGYDVLREILLDKPEDLVVQDPSILASNHHHYTEDDGPYPFPMSLKADTKTLMRMITDGQVEKPRYTAWMREIQSTVEKHIEPITFLSQVLEYDFASEFEQLQLKPDQSSSVHNKQPSDLIMVDEGVVDYLITHLRLICTLVTTPPTTFRKPFTEREQEKVRLEIMLSGFDKVGKTLQMCPHPTVYASYIRYLQPLLRPWADITTKEQGNHPTLWLSTTNNNRTMEDDDDDDDDDSLWEDMEFEQDSLHSP